MGNCWPSSYNTALALQVKPVEVLLSLIHEESKMQINPEQPSLWCLSEKDLYYIYNWRPQVWVEIYSYCSAALHCLLHILYTSGSNWWLLLGVNLYWMKKEAAPAICDMSRCWLHIMIAQVWPCVVTINATYKSLFIRSWAVWQMYVVFREGYGSEYMSVSGAQSQQD